MSLFNKFFSMFSRGTSVSTTTSVVSNTNNNVNNAQQLSAMKVAELRTMARTMGLSGYSSMRKADLVNYIEQNQA